MPSILDHLFGVQDAVPPGATPTLDSLLGRPESMAPPTPLGTVSPKDDATSFLNMMLSNADIGRTPDIAYHSSLLPLSVTSTGQIVPDGHSGAVYGAAQAIGALPDLAHNLANEPIMTSDPQGRITDAGGVAGADTAGVLNAATTLGAGSASFERPANSLGIFGGRLAKTADLDNFDAAQAMSTLQGMPGYEDVTPASIHADTGWFPGADGNARFEIPDHVAQVIPGAPAQGMLPQLLDHPQLYEAYPHFADMTYNVAPGEPGWSGTYSQAKNHIDVAPSEYPDELKATILHELQHGVQATEGFARGGDARMLAGGQDAYNRLMGEVEARNVETRMRMPPGLLSDIPPWATESVRRPNQLQSAPSILDAYFAARPPT